MFCFPLVIKVDIVRAENQWSKDTDELKDSSDKQTDTRLITDLKVKFSYFWICDQSTYADPADI